MFMLKERSSEQEIMDDLDVSGSVIDQTLRELNTINKTLGGNQISISAFKKLSKYQDQLVLADLGCGGGDIMVEMAKWARKVEKKVTFIGIDANPHIIGYAENNTKDFPEITYKSINIFSKEFQEMEFDIIHCCLFLHHFSSEELVELFTSFKKQSKKVIVNDLHRHPLAYWSIKFLTTLFSRSEMVRNDAAVSVARGFKRSEIRAMMDQAGIKDYSLRWRWAFRWEVVF